MIVDPAPIDGAGEAMAVAGPTVPAAVREDLLPRGVTPVSRTSDRAAAEHVAWAKERALEYVDQGDLQNAFASLMSDLGKHPDTANHAAIELGMMLMMAGNLSTTRDMRDFIEGCN